ncbi:glycosyltransferase family 4 protein [Pseudaquabacterium rugosum]|uniref:Glycosyltransferase n=1 Tax=Pseudaquabacterium rugosum TaxID=2984194 RepID=A0ABU9BA98_9BURK
MKTIAVYVSAYPCNSAEPSAGTQLALQKVKQLATEYDQVYVFSFCRYALPPEQGFPSNVLASDIRIGRWHTLLSQILFPLHPLGVAVRMVAIRSAGLSKIPNPDLVYGDFTQSFGCVPTRWTSKAEVRIHDTVRELYGRQSRSGSIPRRLIGLIESLRWRWYEPFVWRSARAVHCLTDREAEAVSTSRGSSTGVLVERPIPSYVCRTRTAASVVKGRLIFWGNLARPENSLAVEYFLENLWPAIKKAVPTAEFRVVGANPPQALLARASDGVSFTGFVDDPAVEFEKAHLSVAPLTFGAGIKIKVLETAFSGIPTICTQVAADGIWDDVPNVIVAGDDRAFVKECVARLS